MVPSFSSGDGSDRTVRCLDCLFWMPPEKKGEGYHCFLTLHDIPRRRAGEDRVCPGYVDRYDVIVSAAASAWAAGLRRRDLP